MIVKVGSEVKILKTLYATVTITPSERPMDTAYSKPFGVSGSIEERALVTSARVTSAAD